MAHTETELKLRLAAQDVPRLLAHPLLADTPKTLHLFNTYFDTPDLALKARRIAVRERRIGDQTLLTVKTAGQSVGGLTRRSEWEAPTQPGQPDFAALVDDPGLAAELAALAPRLRPVFRTDFQRRRWVLAHGGAQIELALDEGLISSGHSAAAPDGTRHEPILELELELLDGTADALLSLATTLQADDRTAWLHPFDLSKAQRGLALFLQDNALPYSPPERRTMSTITLRFLAEPSTVNFGGKVHGGTVMKWIDEAGYACATSWSKRYCVTVYVGGIRFHRPIMIGDLVEVEARLAYTGSTSMNIAVEVRSGDMKGGQLQKTTECLIVFVSVDSHGRPMPVEAWTPSTPGEVALAQSAKAQLDASRATQKS